MPVNLENIDCLLFDLDGTLLPMDMNVFIQEYFKLLQVRAAPYIPPEKFVKYLWAATGAMVENEDPMCANHDVFWHHFSHYAQLPRVTLEPVFEEFYLREFPSLARTVQPNPLSREIVSRVLEKGKQVVLATNPIFPSIAVLERMRWANIHDLPWALVTTYENSRYCKPKLAYYSDILEQLDLSPVNCLMVGNDVQEDLVASMLGIHTYLVTDCMLDKGAPSYEPTLRGSLYELREWLESS